MTEQVITTRQALPAFIEGISIASNEDQEKTVDLSTGVIRVQYWESILQDGIRATVIYADSGNTIDEKTAIDGLPIVGQEKAQITFTDNNEETLDLTMYVNKVSPFYDDSTKSGVLLDLVSKEFIMNQKVRVSQRYDGKISDHIKTILTDVLKVDEEKITDENIEATQNNYNFIGLNKKPYYMLNYLSKASVPSTQNSEGNTAGFFFYETSKGYQFKSIDSLLSQEKKKSIIYNETPDSGGANIPEGYDMKALQFEKENSVNVQNKLRMGAYSTRTVVFDPFNCKYEVLNKEAKKVEEEEGIQTAGERLPVFNPEFNTTQDGSEKIEFSRTMYMLLDTGSLPSGGSGQGGEPVKATEQQLEKSKEQNFQAQKILAQSVMRYNQLFAAMNTITIAGDFSLHAGDAIFVDAPELQADTKNDEVNQESGGLYIIADLCHYVTPTETYTKLNLVRDTFGRKGTPTS
tara:strand:+ start:1213 stop:2598 length:1386 start_codon:yes stop_codon:yes gene_type:complete